MVTRRLEFSLTFLYQRFLLLLLFQSILSTYNAYKRHTHLILF